MWGTTEELLAQIVEEISVLTSQHKRSEPLRVKRPDAIEAAVEEAREARERASDTYTETAEGGIRAVGNQQLLSYFASRGAVQMGGAA